MMRCEPTVVIHDPLWIRSSLMDTLGGLREGCLDNAYRRFGFFQTQGQQGLDGIDLVIVNHFEHMGEVGQGLTVSLPKNAATPAAASAMVVKKSDNGICYKPSSPSHEKSAKFTRYPSLDKCLKIGGKAPKK